MCPVERLIVCTLSVLQLVVLVCHMPGKLTFRRKMLFALVSSGCWSRRVVCASYGLKRRLSTATRAGAAWSVSVLGISWFAGLMKVPTNYGRPARRAGEGEISRIMLRWLRGMRQHLSFVTGTTCCGVVVVRGGMARTTAYAQSEEAARHGAMAERCMGAKRAGVYWARRVQQGHNMRRSWGLAMLVARRARTEINVLYGLLAVKETTRRCQGVHGSNPASR